jgi:hypothetical protein
VYLVYLAKRGTFYSVGPALFPEPLFLGAFPGRNDEPPTAYLRVRVPGRRTGIEHLEMLDQLLDEHVGPDAA